MANIREAVEMARGVRRRMARPREVTEERAVDIVGVFCGRWAVVDVVGELCVEFRRGDERGAGEAGEKLCRNVGRRSGHRLRLLRPLLPTYPLVVGRSP